MSRIAAKKYGKAHPEKIRERCQRRRARIAGAIICDFTSEQWEFIKQQYDHKCYYCGKKKKLTIDHITALVNGGNHTMSNIVPACLQCNSSKHTKNAPIPVQPLLALNITKDTRKT